MKNFYNILGVSQGATKKEISDAYRKLVLKYHPDRIKDEKLRKEAESKMLEINEAYDVLGNDNKRGEYDAQLRYGTSYNRGYDNYYGNNDETEFGNSFSKQFNFGFGDIHNVFKQFFEMETENFSHSSHDNAPRRQVEIVLTMKEWYNGCTKSIKYTRNVECLSCVKKDIKCSVCRGSGSVPSLFAKVKCTACDGKGLTKQRISCNMCKTGSRSESTSIKVNVPPFINKKLTVQNHGDYHGNGYGNLEIKFSLERDLFYKIEDLNINVDVSLSLEDFIYGTTISLNYLNDSVIKMDIRPMQTESILVKGKGIYLNGERGDLIVNLKYLKNFTKSVSKTDLKNLFGTEPLAKQDHYSVITK